MTYCDVISLRFHPPFYWISDVSLILSRAYVARDLSLCGGEMYSGS